jgi:hypothetical protein
MAELTILKTEGYELIASGLADEGACGVPLAKIFISA